MPDFLYLFLLGVAASILITLVRGWDRRAKAQGAVSVAVDSSELPDAELRSGIGGWLLLFVAILLIVQPLISALELYGRSWVFGPPMRILSRFPGAVEVFWLEFIAIGLVGVLSLLAGILCVLRSEYALTAARVFLWAYVISVTLEVLVSVGYRDPGSLWPEGARRLAMGWTFFAIWYAYLARSRRVARTFPSKRVLVTLGGVQAVNQDSWPEARSDN